MSASRLEIGPSWPAGLARRSPTSIPRAVGRRLAGRAPPARDPGADRSNVPNPARAPEHECRPQGRRGQQVAPRAGRDHPARFTFGDGGSPTASAPPYCIPTATPTDLAASPPQRRPIWRFTVAGVEVSLATRRRGPALGTARAAGVGGRPRGTATPVLHLSAGSRSATKRTRRERRQAEAGSTATPNPRPTTSSRSSTSFISKATRRGRPSSANARVVSGSAGARRARRGHRRGITSDAGRVRAQPCGAPLTEQAPMTRQRS